MKLTVSSENFRLVKCFTTFFTVLQSLSFLNLQLSGSGCGAAGAQTVSTTEVCGSILAISNHKEHVFQLYYKNRKDINKKGLECPIKRFESSLFTVPCIKQHHSNLIILIIRYKMSTNQLPYWLYFHRISDSPKYKSTHICLFGECVNAILKHCYRISLSHCMMS